MATVKDGSVTPLNTYQDSPGQPSQGSLIYAVSVGTWWFYQINSAKDSTGNPGTHTISAYYRADGDPAGGAWTYYGESPNLNASSANTSVKFDGGLGGGRSLGCAYFNNPGGTNKDQAIIVAGLSAAGGGNGSINGMIRVVLGATTLSWGSWGGWTTQSWTLVGGSTAVVPAYSCGITLDGYVQVAGCILHSELDAAVLTSVDPIGDAWNAGAIDATGNVTSASGVISNMSHQTNLKVGMCISDDAGDWSPNRIPSVATINSSTQVTVTAGTTSGVTATGTNLRWWQGSSGTNRTNSMLDSSMVHECSGYAFAPLASNGMLLVYGDGGATNGDFTDLKSIKPNQTQAQGYWPSTTDGTGSVTVFGSAVTIKNNDWCLAPVNVNTILCLRRTGATTLAARTYSPATNSWSATPNQPPTMTGKNIVAGGGLGVGTDGTDLWVAVIDSTDGAIKYTKYTASTGTWSAWAAVTSVGATAAFLTGTVGNGYLTLVWSEKNANNVNYDTKLAQLSVGPHAGTVRPAAGGLVRVAA